MGDGGLISLTCRDCGRLITRHGRTGVLIHRSGGAVASCDLDGDHQPRPDWQSVGTVRCGVCGSPATAGEDGELHHDPTELDTSHAPDPWARSGAAGRTG